MPAPVTYADGRTVKTPRGCAAIWRAANGKYLMWIHNTALQLHSTVWPMTGRDQAWLIGGVERNGRIEWSQPELVCYGPPTRGVSYPDLVEVDGKFFISATNKREARLIEVDPELIAGLWRQRENKTAARKGIIFARAAAVKSAQSVAMPRLPDLRDGGGFAVELRLKFDDLKSGQVLLDSRDEQGRGLALTTGTNGRLQFIMNDGVRSFAWASDAATISTGKVHHVTVSVDGGPKMLTFVIDGRLNDGGDDPARPFGTGRFWPVEDKVNQTTGPQLGDVSGGPWLRLAPSLQGELRGVKIYDRYLRTSEAIANYRASD